MELQIGKTYKMQFSKHFYGGSILIVKYIGYRPQEDGYEVETVKVVTWCASYQVKPEPGHRYIVGRENILYEVK